MSLRARLFIGLSVLASACQSPSTPVDEVAVEIAVGDPGVALARVYDVADFPVVRFQSPAVLRYELRADGGAVIVQGVFPDVRWAHSETPDRGALTRRDVRLGHGVANLRLPAQAGDLVILEPRESGAVELGRVRFDPDARELRSDPDRGAPAGVGSSTHAVASEDDVLGDPVLIGANGSAIKILILPDGFKEEELPTFEADVSTMVGQLFKNPDWQPYADAFRIQRQNVRSKDSGIDEPDKDDKDTAFDLHFGGSTRRCAEFGGPHSFLFFGNEAEDLARDLAKKAGADLIVVITNAAEDVGCALPGIIVMDHGADAGASLAHELGHSILELADEYVEESGFLEGFRCGGRSFFGIGEAANASNEADDAPWADLMTSGVTLPTPDDAAHANDVGAFEGANYCSQNWYRPQHDCLMRTLGVKMCAACAREMDRFFGALGVKPADLACPERFRADGICDPCLGDDPDCTPRCEIDGTCGLQEDCAICPEDCGSCGQIGEAPCGDGDCDGDETDESCPEDCGCAAQGCSGEIAPWGCYCDEPCTAAGDCCADACDMCGACG